MNGFFSNAPQSGAQSWYGPADLSPGMGNTNVYKVTSLDEAIMRSNMRPSETVYFHQSKPEFYNIRVDLNGNKTWQIFPYIVASPAENADVPVSREEYNSLVERLNKLESKGAESAEVTDNG